MRGVGATIDGSVGLVSGALERGLEGALAGALEGALSLLYPPTCVGCGVEHPMPGPYLCAHCEEAMRQAVTWECPICGHPVAQARTFCPGCLRRWPRVRCVVSLGPYVGPLARLVKAFKMGGATLIGVWLADRLADRLLCRVGGIDVVVAVPCTRADRRRRGFDPPGLVAGRLARALAVPLETGVLVKARQTPRLKSLAAIDREVVLEGAYTLAQDGPVRGKTVLLVDDVYTTGATFEVLTELLRDSGGAQQVLGAVLARTVVDAGLA